MTALQHVGSSWGSPQGAPTVLGSGSAGIDTTVVTVALPTIGADLGTDFSALQWMVTAHALTLASFILLGGSLGDRYERRRTFVLGVLWFAVASRLCGLAPDAGLLVVAALAIRNPTSGTGTGHPAHQDHLSRGAPPPP